MQNPYLVKPLLSHEIIGRETELAGLLAGLNLALEGRPQLLLLSGEAGLGKSRLCQALTEAGQSRDAVVLTGQSRTQDQGLPFGPFVDAFRGYYTLLARQNPEILPPGLGYFLRLLPELKLFYPAATPVSDDILGSPAQQQQHLFQNIVFGLQAIQQVAPLVLILEDLQWADQTSLELLGFLAGQSTADRFLLLGTYRTEALAGSPALSQFLLQLNNRRKLHEIKLKPLNGADHQRLVSHILGQPVSKEYSSLLYDRDEGNPFYTEELLGAMVAAGQLQQQDGRWIRQPGLVISLPLSLKASIIERVASLPPAEQEALAFASVIGREFDFELLAELSGLTERQLLAGLRRAIGLQLIVEIAGADNAESERYQFRHALTREAIYGDMLTRERRLRHREVAEKLEQRQGAGNFDRLISEHFWLASLPEKARPYALREAERARQVFAFREERYYLQIALASLPEDNPERLELLHRLGNLSLAVMDVPAALDWLNKAKNGFQKAGQNRKAARVLVDLTFTAWFFDPATHPVLLNEQVAAAELSYNDPDESVQDIDALSNYANASFGLAAADLHTQSKLWVERSLQLSEKLADPMKFGALQMALLARGVTRTDGEAGEVESGLADIRQVVDFARQYSLPDLAMLSYSVLLMALINLGFSEQAEALIREITDYETRSGMPPTSNLKGWQRYYSGDWDTALAELRVGIEYVPIPTVNALYRLTMAHILIDRGELAEAEQQLITAAPVLEPLQFAYYAPFLWAQARLHTAAHRPAQAADYYNKVITLWRTTADNDTMVPILLDGVKFYAASPNLLKSREWLVELQKVSARTGSAVAQAALREAEGIQAAAEGAFEDGIEQLNAAAQEWRKLQRPYLAAQVEQRLACLLLDHPGSDRNSRAHAEELLQKAAEVYRRLNLPAKLAEIEAVRLGSGLENQSKRRATLEAARQPFKGLTRREVQVLIQLAGGLTNKEIAATLQITEGTVELHVNHILSKLDVETRTQAATYAVAQGWIKTAS